MNKGEEPTDYLTSFRSYLLTRHVEFVPLFYLWIVTVAFCWFFPVLLDGPRGGMLPVILFLWPVYFAFEFKRYKRMKKRTLNIMRVEEDT